MRIIAFDLGRNFAWAGNVGGLSFYHVELHGGSRAHRLGFLINYLSKVLSWKGYDVAVYETPFARGRDATRSLWGIAGIIEACATNAGLPVVDVAVPTIKKFATGHGKASKDQMIKAAQRMGYKGSNEHEADAVCLLRYAEANLERVLK